MKDISSICAAILITQYESRGFARRMKSLFLIGRSEGKIQAVHQILEGDTETRKVIADAIRGQRNHERAERQENRRERHEKKMFDARQLLGGKTFEGAG